MGRWIAFDEESTAAAAARTQTAVVFQRGNALAAALASGKKAIVVLPGTRSGEVLLLNISHAASSHNSCAPVAYEASGFLGLIDEPVFPEEPQPEKKWWQKILD